MTMTAAEAKMEMALLQADIAKQDLTDIIVNFTNSGLSQEVITRMQDLVGVTKKIGAVTFDVGKILLWKIWEFVKRNPGMAVGAIVGAAIGSLTSMIPFIGPMLAPIATALGAVTGAVLGHQADRALGLEGGGNIFTLAKEFFRLIAEIFHALKDYFSN